MGKIKLIQENEYINGESTVTSVYPVTATKAVYNNNNENLDTIINDLKIDIISNSNAIENIHQREEGAIAKFEEIDEQLDTHNETIESIENRCSLEKMLRRDRYLNIFYTLETSFDNTGTLIRDINCKCSPLLPVTNQEFLMFYGSSSEPYKIAYYDEDLQYINQEEIIISENSGQKGASIPENTAYFRVSMTIGDESFYPGNTIACIGTPQVSFGGIFHELEVLRSQIKDLNHEVILLRAELDRLS